MEIEIEEWRSIQSSCGFKLTENKYEVSSFGRVRNALTKELYSTNPRKTDDYVVISLSLRDGNRRNFYLQRLIYDTFRGPLIDDLVVDHLNFDRSDNCIWNLIMCTQEENINRSLEHGRMKIRGSTNNKAKLKESDVDMICLEFENGNFNYTDVLIRVGLEPTKKNRDILTKIRRKQLWKHVSDNYNYDTGQSRTMNTYTAMKDDLTELVNSGLTVTEIAHTMNIDLSDRKVYQKFHKYISRLRK